MDYITNIYFYCMNTIHMLLNLKCFQTLWSKTCDFVSVSV